MANVHFLNLKRAFVALVCLSKNFNGCDGFIADANASKGPIIKNFRGEGDRRADSQYEICGVEKPATVMDSVRVQASDGSIGLIPKDRDDDAIKASGKLA